MYNYIHNIIKLINENFEGIILKECLIYYYNKDKDY